jgi:hypothetical protein
MSISLSRSSISWNGSISRSITSVCRPQTAVWRGCTTFTRRIRDFAEAYPEVAEEGQPLLDFMKAFKPGRKKEKKESGEGEG